MKKLLIYALLLSHLCTGLVFASETHSEAFVVHDETGMELLAVVDHLHGDHDASYHSADMQSDVHYDDHHCHGSAHLVGLICSQLTPLVPLRNLSFLMRSQASVQIFTPPLLRPPIV